MDLLVVQGTLKSLLQHYSSKISILQRSAFFIIQLSHPYMTTGKTIAFTRWTFFQQSTISAFLICCLGLSSGGDGIPIELFQILKDDAVKVLHSICPTNLENSAVATGLEKVSFHSNPKERQCQRMLKLPHNCTHLTCQ